MKSIADGIGLEAAHRRSVRRYRAMLSARWRASSSAPAGASASCPAGMSRWPPSIAATATAQTSGPFPPTSNRTTPPGCLPDGRILYTRWEYVDRSREHFHHLWVMNPDGTGQMTYYGNMHPGDVFLDAKPVPGTAPSSWSTPPTMGARSTKAESPWSNMDLGPDAAEPKPS